MRRDAFRGNLFINSNVAHQHAHPTRVRLSFKKTECQGTVGGWNCQGASDLFCPAVERITHYTFATYLLQPETNSTPVREKNLTNSPPQNLRNLNPLVPVAVTVPELNAFAFPGLTRIGRIPLTLRKSFPLDRAIDAGNRRHTHSHAGMLAIVSRCAAIEWPQVFHRGTHLAITSRESATGCREIVARGR